MQKVQQYIKKNWVQVNQIFKTYSQNNIIVATRIFQFLQNIFNTKQIKFIENNKNFFHQQQNSQIIENLIENYYKTTDEGKKSKFYMYRVYFQFGQVIQIIKFWLKNDNNIRIEYQDSDMVQVKEQVQVKDQYKIKEQQNKYQKDSQKSNDNDLNIKDIPIIIEKYKKEILSYEQIIKSQSLTEDEIAKYKNKINQLETKIVFLEEKLNINNKIDLIGKQKILSQSDEVRKSQLSQRNQSYIQSVDQRSIKSISPSKMQNFMKSIFQFYAKQIHVTGVKASFERIQHESNRMNYQKLVHFLREFKIFPEKASDQKKLHQLYIKHSSNTRDLTFQGFSNLLQKLAQIVIQDDNFNNNNIFIKNKGQILKTRILQQKKKNRLLNNPFHSLQKQDFRIDKSSLKYEFKLMPLNGKDSDQINGELEFRRKMKEQEKKQKQRKQLTKKVRYIKKLESIDPFHPLVQKNKHLYQQKSILQSQPVASLDNIQKYRDSSFDIKQIFGIQVNEDSLLNGISNDQNKNRIKQVEKFEVEKMKSLMKGIVERSNVKLEKLGLSPNRKRNYSGIG